MDENATITLGYYVEKPVVSQEECDRYAAMAQAVNEHNWACKVGDMTWSIEDKDDCYEVVEGGVLPEPGDPEPTLDERLTTLQNENTALKEQIAAQESNLTDLQLALCELYETSEEGGET